MIITLQHLSIISAIVKFRTITKAAEVLHLSQPALSHQIGNLEELLGVRIFIRAGRTLALTSQGKQLLLLAERVLPEVDRVEKLVTGVQSDERRVRLSLECYTTYFWLPEFLKRIANLGVKVEIRSSDSPIDSLMHGEIDLCITSQIRGKRGLHLTKVLEDEMVVVCSSEHRLSDRSAVTLSDLRNEHFVVYDLEGPGNYVVSRLFRKANFQPAAISRVGLTETILDMVSANIGVAILAEWAVQPRLRSMNLSTLRLKHQDGRRTWYSASIENSKLFMTLHRELKSSIGRKGN